MAPSFIQYFHQGGTSFPQTFLEEWIDPFAPLGGVQTANRPVVHATDDGVVLVSTWTTEYTSSSSRSGRVLACIRSGSDWQQPETVVSWSRGSISGGYRRPIGACTVGGQHYVWVLFERGTSSSSASLELYKRIVGPNGPAWSKQSFSRMGLGDYSLYGSVAPSGAWGFSGTDAYRRCSLTTSSGTFVEIVTPGMTPNSQAFVVSIQPNGTVTGTDIFPPGTSIQAPQLIEGNGRIYLFYYGEFAGDGYVTNAIMYRSSLDGHVWTDPQPAIAIPNPQPMLSVSPQADGSLVLVAQGDDGTITGPAEYQKSRHLYYNRLFNPGAPYATWQWETVQNPQTMWPPRLVNQISDTPTRQDGSAYLGFANEIVDVTTGFAIWHTAATTATNGTVARSSWAAAVGEDDLGEPILIGAGPKARGAVSDVTNRTVIGFYDSFSYTDPTDLRHHWRRIKFGSSAPDPGQIEIPQGPFGWANDAVPGMFARSTDGRCIVAIVPVINSECHYSVYRG